MAFNIKLPLINGKTDAEQIYQIKRYLYQLAEDLKYNLNTLEAGTSDEASIEKTGLIDSLNKWRIGIQGDIGSIANIRQTVSSQGASITALSEWKKDAVNSISKIDQISTEDYASLTGLAQYKTDTSDSLTRIEGKADANSGQLSIVTAWKGRVENDVSGIAAIKQRADDNAAAIKLLTEFNAGGEVTSLAELVTKASQNETKIIGLTEWRDGVKDSIAKIEQISNADYASLTGLAQYKTDTSDSLTRIEGKADANASSISTLAEWKNSVSGEISSIASIKALAETNKASVGILVDNGNVKGNILIEAINNESVAKISADRLDVEGKTLNIKVDATNISGTLNANQINVPDLNAFGATIGGFTIDNNSIHTRMGTSDRILLCSGTSARYTVNGFTSTGWSILAGNNFGVLKDGTMYAANANISGTINSNNGSIGDWGISPKGLFYGDENQPDILFKPTGDDFLWAVAGGNLRGDWRMLIGSDFGIASTGELFCSKGFFGYKKANSEHTRSVVLEKGVIQLNAPCKIENNITYFPLIEFVHGGILYTLMAQKSNNSWGLTVVDETSEDFVTWV